MPYTNRQLQCLDAMGIVPWVLRDTTSNPLVSISGATTTAVSEAVSTDTAESELAVVSPDAASSADLAAPGGSISSLPADLAELSAALPGKAITALNIRGNWQNSLGSLDASVLVVVQPPTDSAVIAELPLSNQEAQLFEQMLRAIGLTRKDITQCVLQTASEDTVAGGGEAVAAMESATVETLSGGSVRAVLLLQSDIGESEVAAEHQFAFGSASIPAWRLPHPARLLSEPMRKRQAWQILKAVRCVLAANS